jgi:hypothetical protein
MQYPVFYLVYSQVFRLLKGRALLLFAFFYGGQQRMKGGCAAPVAGGNRQ